MISPAGTPRELEIDLHREDVEGRIRRIVPSGGDRGNPDEVDEKPVPIGTATSKDLARVRRGQPVGRLRSSKITKSTPGSF